MPPAERLRVDGTNHWLHSVGGGDLRVKFVRRERGRAAIQIALNGTAAIIIKREKGDEQLPAFSLFGYDTLIAF